ncbi:MlaD family protein [Nocardia stercoris]|uniref:MCE family protein n=1 Tax=Nocardia stercoris TaxID=2483361 RepID=A0A3M2L6U9_9NOCA|nr:MlaD family protein [Nocardia stercoris]RMI32716.1 MCE family protein [Nocardia stercoris]
MKVGAAAWRLALFAAVLIGVLVVVITAIQRPVSGPTERHDALFTDANGLKVGDDVRLYGVQVGKVKHIALDGPLARVQLTVKTDTPVFDNSKLAIRYQALTGQRYIDLQQQPHTGTRIADGATIGTDHTVPSFDVTAMFNGLQPVLATLSPEAINQFSTSMIALIEGDGSGIGPALDAIEKLASYVDNRQQVIGTIIGNASDLADRVGGRVHYLVPLLARLTDIFQSLESSMGGLTQFALAAPSVLRPLDALLQDAGLRSGTDVNAAVEALFPDPQQAVDVLGKLPTVLTSIDAAAPATAGGWKPQCAGGIAATPPLLQVLLAGQQVTVCNR